MRFFYNTSLKNSYFFFLNFVCLFSNTVIHINVLLPFCLFVSFQSKKNSVSITHSCIGEHRCLPLICLIFRTQMERLHLQIKLLQGRIPWRLKWRPDQLFHSCAQSLFLSGFSIFCVGEKSKCFCLFEETVLCQSAEASLGCLSWWNNHCQVLTDKLAGDLSLLILCGGGYGFLVRMPEIMAAN